jgi:hypothetical protein
LNTHNPSSVDVHAGTKAFEPATHLADASGLSSYASTL